VGAGRLIIEPQSLTQKQNPAVLYFPLRNQCYNEAKKKKKLKRKPSVVAFGNKKIWRVPMTEMARKKRKSIDSNGNTK
jgi:hypothetical protein